MTAKTRIVYIVHAPAEGDGPEDATDWYFRDHEAAERFATEASDHEILNPWEGSYPVRQAVYSAAQYKKLRFTEYE